MYKFYLFVCNARKYPHKHHIISQRELNNIVIQNNFGYMSIHSRIYNNPTNSEKNQSKNRKKQPRRNNLHQKDLRINWEIYFHSFDDFSYISDISNNMI